MAQNATPDGGTEREPTHFEDSINADTVVAGDRINRNLVGRHPNEIGDPRQPDGPGIELVTATAVDRYDDVHRAILYDPERELFIRGARHSRQQAWTQEEVDWTVHDVGTEVSITEVHNLERPEDEQDEPAEQYAQSWTEVLFDDISYNDGELKYHDEVSVSGSRLMLRDFDGRKLDATIELH